MTQVNAKGGKTFSNLIWLFRIAHYYTTLLFSQNVVYILHTVYLDVVHLPNRAVYNQHTMQCT